MFLFPDNVCLGNCADDTTLCSIGENRSPNRNILNKNFVSLQKWLYDNYMVLNPGKCCYMSFGSNPDRSGLILEDSTKLPSAEDRQQADFLQPPEKSLYKNANKLKGLT